MAPRRRLHLARSTVVVAMTAFPRAHGTLAESLPDAWQVACEIAQRAGGDPGFPGLYGPLTAPTPSKPQRLAILETDGWATATPAAKQAFEEASAKLRFAGIALKSRCESAVVADAEDAIHGARELSIAINTWERECCGSPRGRRRDAVDETTRAVTA